VAAIAFNPAVAQTPKRGGTLTYLIPADAPPSFDAHRETTYATIHSAAPYYSVLIRVPPDNPASTTEFACDLCTEMPKPTDDGTTFLVTEGAGKEEGPAFVTLNTNSTLNGVVLYHPQQNADDVPKAYPWAIDMRGKNPAVLAVEMLNPYNGIDAP
jgi:hypothetical protein